VKPSTCWHCGPRGYVRISDVLMTGGDYHYLVLCMECGSRGPLKPTKDEAIIAWNTRIEVNNEDNDHVN
jgi:hypothetical protein